MAAGVAICWADEPDARAPAGAEPLDALQDGIPGRRPGVAGTGREVLQPFPLLCRDDSHTLSRH